MTYPVSYKDPFNPRFRCAGTHMERTFEILEVAEDLGGKTGELLKMLKDCWPEGSERDQRGSTSRQVSYLGYLAGFEDRDMADFMRAALGCGGLSVVQVGHLIEKLKEENTSTPSADGAL